MQLIIKTLQGDELSLNVEPEVTILQIKQDLQESQGIVSAIIKLVFNGRLLRDDKTIEESYTNAAMEWGTNTEPQARVAYEVKTGNFVDQVAFIDHPTIAGFGCSPDGLVGENLIEIKCPNSATHWEYFKAKEPPKKYFIQMQAQMAVTGAKWCDFVSFDPRMPERSQLLIVNIPRDDVFILIMESEIKQFLSEVDAEVKLMENQ